MVIVPRPGDPINDEIHEKYTFSIVFHVSKKIQAWLNRLTRPG